MLYRIIFTGALAASLPACGGGDTDGPLSTATDFTAGAIQSAVTATPPVDATTGTALDPTTAEAAQAPASSCSALAALPTRPNEARSLASFGVVPSDIHDNAAGIQAALDALKPGEWLVFPAGRYVHSRSLRVRVPGVVLWSEGATLIATNPDDTAIMLQADGASLYGFRLHTVTSTRGSKLTHARIAIAPAGTGRVRDVTVRRNIIENGGPPDTPLANGSSASGIMVYRAENFLVAENTIKRTLADGIHVTAGSLDGRVIKNTVRENGDDMIAVVSYMGSAGTPISTLLANLPTLRAERLTRNILIAHNDVAGQYWGRGITVVGGEDITIESNRITETTYAAGILLARESGYLTFGVHNVVVQNNTVQHVQTTAPVYSVGAKATAARTGHAGIEIHSLATAEELQDPTIRSVIAVDSVRIENNVVDDTFADGMRLGVGAGPVGLVGLIDNKLSKIGKAPINVKNAPTPEYNVFCDGNTLDGSATSSNLCMGAKPAATGAQLNCKD